MKALRDTTVGISTDKGARIAPCGLSFREQEERRH